MLYLYVMKLDEKKCVDDEFSLLKSLKSSLHCTHVRRELNSVWRGPTQLRKIVERVGG